MAELSRDAHMMDEIHEKSFYRDIRKVGEYEYLIQTSTIDPKDLKLLRLIWGDDVSYKLDNHRIYKREESVDDPLSYSWVPVEDILKRLIQKELKYLFLIITAKGVNYSQFLPVIPTSMGLHWGKLPKIEFYQVCSQQSKLLQMAEENRREKERQASLQWQGLTATIGVGERLVTPTDPRGIAHIEPEKPRSLRGSLQQLGREMGRLNRSFRNKN